MAEATSATNAKKLDEILKRLGGSPEDSLHNIEVLNEKILGDVIDIKDRVKRLEINVILGYGEPPLKEQVHSLRRDLEENNEIIKQHLEDDKKRVEKTSTLWEKVGFEFLRILPGLLLAYLLITLRLK